MNNKQIVFMHLRDQKPDGIHSGSIATRRRPHA